MPFVCRCLLLSACGPCDQSPARVCVQRTPPSLSMAASPDGTLFSEPEGLVERKEPACDQGLKVKGSRDFIHVFPLCVCGGGGGGKRGSVVCFAVCSSL